MNLLTHLRMKKGTSEKALTKEQLDHSSTINRNLGLFFVTLLVFTGVTLSGVTDLTLLKSDSAVQLPLLNINVPLESFFLWTPLIMMGFHLNILLNLFQHSQKLFHWLKNNPGNWESQSIQSRPFLFDMMVILRRDSKRNRLPFVSTVVLVNMIAFYAPATMMLAFQLRFSDYHNFSFTSWHFLLVSLDLFALILLRPRILGSESSDKTIWERIRSRASYGQLSLVAAAIGLFGYGSLNLVILGGVVNAEQWVNGIMLDDNDCTFSGDFTFIYKPRINIDEPYLMAGHYEVQHVMTLMDNRKLKPGLAKDSFMYEFGIGISLRNRDLSYAYLSGGYMDHCDLRDAILRNATMCGVSLRKAKMQGCDLSGAKLLAANLTHSTLTDAKMVGTVFNDAIMLGTDLDSVEASQAQFQNVNLVGANLNYGIFTNADFSGATMNGISFKDARANQAIFLGCGMAGADLSSCQLIQADLSGSNFYRSCLNDVKLYDSNLRGTIFNLADLTRADLSRSELQNAQFNNSVLEACTLRAVFGLNTEFYCSNMSNALLGSAVFIKPQIKGAKLSVSLNDLAVVIGADTTRDFNASNLEADSVLSQCSPSWFFEREAFESFRQKMQDPTSPNALWSAQVNDSDIIEYGFLELRRRMLISSPTSSLHRLLIPWDAVGVDRKLMTRINDSLCTFTKEHCRRKWQKFLRECQMYPDEEGDEYPVSFDVKKAILKERKILLSKTGKLEYGDSLL